jgi:hypothetical protein
MFPCVSLLLVKYSHGTAPLPDPLTPATAFAGAVEELAFAAYTVPSFGEVTASKAKTGVVLLEK